MTFGVAGTFDALHSSSLWPTDASGVSNIVTTGHTKAQADLGHSVSVNYNIAMLTYIVPVETSKEDVL